MNFMSIIVLFCVSHFSNANVLEDLYSGLNENIEKVMDYGTSVFKKPLTEVNLRPTTPAPITAPTPVKPVLAKSEKKSEFRELCSLSLKKSDIVFITIFKKDLKKPLTPIVIDSSTLEFSFAIEKGKKLPGLVDALASMKKYKHSNINKIPIHLQLDPSVIGKLPKLSANDDVILTVIRAAKGKKPARISSHFVDKIIAAPTIKPY